MPVTQITLLPGYSQDVRERLVERVSAAVRATLGSVEAGTVTFVQEAATYRRDGRVLEGGRSAPAEATGVVRSFLEAMGARDLERARAHLAPGFEMVFPGGVRLTALEDLLAWSAGRYRQVAKHIENVDECFAGEGSIVYVSGHLRGQWPEGQPFDEVRFIDRFVVVAGRVLRQDVWNDLAERRAAPP